MELKELINKLNGLVPEIQSILDDVKYEENYNTEALDKFRTEDSILVDPEISKILYSLCNAKDKINYLNKPIKGVGKLIKIGDMKYKSDISGTEYTIGSVLEAFVYDDVLERNTWKQVKIDFNGNSCCFVGFDNLDLEKIKIRER